MVSSPLQIVDGEIGVSARRITRATSYEHKPNRQFSSTYQ
jgi:hypothetical protein